MHAIRAVFFDSIHPFFPTDGIALQLSHRLTQTGINSRDGIHNSSVFSILSPVEFSPKLPSQSAPKAARYLQVDVITDIKVQYIASVGIGPVYRIV